MKSPIESALVQVKTKDDEVERLLSELEYKHNVAAELLLIVNELKQEVKQFEAEYNAQVGRLYVELDQVQLSIREQRLRIRLIREGVSPNSPEMEKRVKECFQQEHEKLNAYQQKADGNAEEQEEDKKLDSSLVKKLRRLYFRLAKIHHPDKAGDDQKDQKQKIMSAINRAYKEKDLQTLERLIGDMSTEPVRSESYKQKRGRLKKEVASLNRNIRQLKLEAKSIRTSHNYRLKLEADRVRKRGGNFFSKLAKDIRREIRASKRNLDRLAVMFGMK